MGAADWALADQTVEELSLDARGRVSWWRPGRQERTLHRVIVHVTYDVARHAGQADIMREQHDTSAGYRLGNPKLPEGYDWPAYVA
jgi:hypothetical protein